MSLRNHEYRAEQSWGLSVDVVFVLVVVIVALTKVSILSLL